MSAFETCRAVELGTRPEEQRWLVEQLWGAEAVGVIGGEPKCGKSFLALDLAVAVASGRPCLRRFAVPQAGTVLLFAAEDALHIVRERLEGIAAVAGVALANLDIHVITAPTVRLDLEADRRSLRDTVAAIRPRLLVLDPFVRLHRCDENVASEVAPLLAYLRELQRAFEAAVLLVHHARKAGHARAGQALRGSSEIHAWGDSNLYLRRKRDELRLTAEHRAAASQTRGLSLSLHAEGGGVALHIVNDDDDGETPAPAKDAPVDRVLLALAAATTPLDIRALRAACRMRMATVCQVVGDLKHRGQVIERDGGYQLP